MVRWLLGGFLIKAEGGMEQPCLRQWEHEGEKLHIVLDQKEQEDLGTCQSLPRQEQQSGN